MNEHEAMIDGRSHLYQTAIKVIYYGPVAGTHQHLMTVILSANHTVGIIYEKLGYCTRDFDSKTLRIACGPLNPARLRVYYSVCRGKEADIVYMRLSG